MSSNRPVAVAVVVSTLAILAACGSSAGSGSGGAGSSGGTSGTSGSGTSGSGTSGTSGSGTSGSGTSGTSGDPCGDLGCKGPEADIFLRVVDNQGKAVVGPTFSLDGQPVKGADCVVTTDAGMGTESPEAGAPCSGEYELVTYTLTKHTIVVSAPGFEPTTVEIALTPSSACCGPDVTEHRTVTLEP